MIFKPSWNPNHPVIPLPYRWPKTQKCSQELVQQQLPSWKLWTLWFSQQCPEHIANLKRAKGVKSGQGSSSVASFPRTHCKGIFQEESKLGQHSGLHCLGPWAAPACEREAQSSSSPSKTPCIALSIKERYFWLKSTTISVKDVLSAWEIYFLCLRGIRNN